MLRSPTDEGIVPVKFLEFKSLFFKQKIWYSLGYKKGSWSSHDLEKKRNTKEKKERIERNFFT